MTRARREKQRFFGDGEETNRGNGAHLSFVTVLVIASDRYRSTESPFSKRNRPGDDLSSAIIVGKWRCV